MIFEILQTFLTRSILYPKLLYFLRKWTKSSNIWPRGAVPPEKNCIMCASFFLLLLLKCYYYIPIFVHNFISLGTTSYTLYAFSGILISIVSNYALLILGLYHIYTFILYWILYYVLYFMLYFEMKPNKIELNWTFRFELQLSSSWQNHNFAPFHIFTRIVIFQVHLHLLDQMLLLNKLSLITGTCQEYVFFIFAMYLWAVKATIL